ncbi:MAG: hypothetical protein HOO93_04500 [Methyloglobulus sp.]|nr:hypothetical protein [Methyloglobulus sp.]
MTIRLTALAALFTAVMSTSVYAHTSLSEDLHTISATAKDVIRYRCPNDATTVFAQAKIRDNSVIKVPAVHMTVQMAPASGTTCPDKNDNAAWDDYGSSTSPSTGGALNDGEGAWSANWTNNMPISSLAYYCMRVTKDGSAKDDYQVDHHCENSSGTHGASTNKTVSPDE